MDNLNGKNNSMGLTVLLIIIISFGWGVSFLSLAILLEFMAPVQILAARWTITVLLLLIPILKGKVHINFHKKNIAFLFLTGLFEPCAYAIFEAYGVKMTSASISAIFVSTIPSMTLLLGILFFRHKADLKLIICLFLAFSGVMIATVFSPVFSASGTRTGMLCMTLAVIAASMYSLSSKKASSDFDALSVTTVMAFEGAILFNIIALCQGYGLETFTVIFTDWRIVINLLFLGVVCAFASYWCYNKLLQSVDATLANNICGSLSTIIGVIAGIIVMSDVWGWYTVIGLGITLAGVWLSTLRIKDSL